MAPPPPPPPGSKAQQLLKGRFGRNLIVAEVATLVGSALLYYKLTTDPNSRAKMQQYAPVVMDAFHTATGGRYRDSDGGGDQ